MAQKADARPSHLRQHEFKPDASSPRHRHTKNPSRRLRTPRIIIQDHLETKNGTREAHDAVVHHLRRNIEFPRQKRDADIDDQWGKAQVDDESQKVDRAHDILERDAFVQKADAIVQDMQIRAMYECGDDQAPAFAVHDLLRDEASVGGRRPRMETGQIGRDVRGGEGAQNGDGEDKQVKNNYGDGDRGPHAERGHAVQQLQEEEESVAARLDTGTVPEAGVHDGD